MNKTIMRICGLLCACLLLAACSGDSDGTAQESFIGTDVSGADFGNALELTDHHGQPRSLGDFRGKVVALFFGYTHCPDVCPTTLDDLAKAVKLLGARRDEVQVLFVTLDPERDTQQVLAQYVPAFDEGFLGLYGDAATTARVAADFKVFFQKQASGGKSGYTIDHSAGIYVFDKQGSLRIYLSHGQKPKDIAHDFTRLF
jgi:protein SCO1/2